MRWDFGHWTGWGAIVAAAAVLTACAADTKSASSAAADTSLPDQASWMVVTPPKHKMFVLDTVAFTRQDPLGVAAGFDIDGLVSTKDDPKGCMHADFVSPEGTPGIDNQFSLIVPLIEKTGIAAFEKLLQSSIESGGVLLMLDVMGLDDWQNDPEVEVKLRAGQGLPLLGTDGKLLTGQTFHVSARDPYVAAGKAALQNGWLTVGPFDVNLPVQVFGKDYTLEMRHGFLRFHITDSDRIDGGLVGGGITLSSIYTIAKIASEDQGNIYDIVTKLMGNMGDLAPDAAGKCTQISAVLSFQGVTGYYYPKDVTPTAP